ncbi:MAG: hypothetical protein PHI51_06160, partial [Candidatus Peribacteraceae bacterium]|nr:hypothetical protein [Candidatus Peribacteraceae bacterium]
GCQHWLWFIDPLASAKKSKSEWADFSVPDPVALSCDSIAGIISTDGRKRRNSRRHFQQNEGVFPIRLLQNKAPMAGLSEHDLLPVD